MKSNPKISFIIPVYNVKPYLRKCVDSILTQDYDDFEIILVDDGSVDGSGEICDEYARIYEFVRVFHQANRGVGSARNYGIEVAKGDYICFLDGDDYWSQNVLGTLMAQVEHEQLDVLRFDYQKVRINSEGEYEAFQPNKRPHYVDERIDVVSGGEYLNERMDYECFPVMYIMQYKYVPFFRLDIHFSEDTEWLPRMMLNTERVNSTSIVVYNYLIRNDSASHPQGKSDKITRNTKDRLLTMKSISNLIPQYPDIIWLNNIRSDLAYDVLTYTSVLSRSVREDFIMQLHALKVFPLIDLKINKKYSQRIFIINRFGPQVYCFIMRCRMACKQLRGN